MDHYTCRICLTKKGAECFKPLIEKVDGDFELTEIGYAYKELTQIMIYPDESRQHLCNYCCLQLNLCREFRQKALEANRMSSKKIYNVESASECGDMDENDQLENFHTEKDEDSMHSENPGNNLEEEYFEVQYLEEDTEDFGSNNNESCIQVYFENKINDNEVDTSTEVSEKQNRTLNQDSEKYSNNDKSKEYVEVKAKAPPKLKTPEELEDDIFIDGLPQHHCRKCNENFHTKHALEMHRKKEHPRMKYSCSQCNKVFYLLESLRVHLNVHKGLPAYKCEDCGKTFKQKAHYVYHMMGHRNERNAQCHLCGKGFLNTSDLRIHLRVHNDERRYACDVCGKRFRAHTHMTNHRYSHFEKQLECEICLQKYTSPNTLRTHIKAVHKNECPYQCETCERRFKRKHHLKAHLKIHQKATMLSKKEYDFMNTS